MSKPRKMWMLFDSYSSTPINGTNAYSESIAWEQYFIRNKTNAGKFDRSGYEARQITVTEGW